MDRRAPFSVSVSGGAHPGGVVHLLQMYDVGVIDLLEDGNFLLQHLDS